MNNNNQYQQFSGAAGLYGVIGDPIDHSKSPELHNGWIQQAGLNAVYVPLHIRAEDFAKAVPNLAKIGFSGWNVTVPHKEQMALLCDELSIRAQLAGAVNCVAVLDNGKLYGDNTDIIGFMTSFEQQYLAGLDLANSSKTISYDDKSLLLLGAGGASRAILIAFLEKNISKIYLTNRTYDKAIRMAEDLTSRYQQYAHNDISGKIMPLEWGEVNDFMTKADIIVNSTVLGMNGKSKLQDSIPGIFDCITPNHIISDIVYDPAETDLLKTAKNIGAITIDGGGMLLYQAIPSFELWFGQKPQIA